MFITTIGGRFSPVHYVPGPCGSGKTRLIAQRAVSYARTGRNLLIVQPTMHLINQTVAEIRSQPGGALVNVTVIHGDTSSSVVGDIVSFLKDDAPGRVLLITHAAHERLPYIHRSDRWHLIYDEAPQAVWSVTRNLPVTHGLITRGLEATSDGLEGYYRITAGDAKYLNGIMRNAKRDELLTSLQDIAAKVLSPHWRVYADAEQWNNMIEGRDDERRQLILHATLQPSLMQGYASASLFTADVDETALFHLWSDARVPFREDKSLTKRLRFGEHENGNLLTISYLSEESWSKSHRDKTAADGVSLLNHAVARINARFGGEPFAWMANTDIPDDVFPTHGTRLPNSPHGINQYQHLHNVALLSALLPAPSTFGFLDALGMDGEAVKTAIMRSSLYQAACRISLRNPLDETPKHAVVPDRATAEWLSSKFPGSTVISEDGMPQVAKGRPGRKRLHESDAARRVKLRHSEQQRLSAILSRLHEEKAACQSTVYATVYASRYETQGLGEIEHTSFDDFASFMHDVWSENVASKTGNIPFVPAEMSGGRRNSDVVSSRMLVLDNDGGDLSRAKFAELFPHLRMVIVNTASSTPDRERWRAFLPLDMSVDAEIYSELVRIIIRRLNRAGYWSKQQLHDNDRIKSRLCHGFDDKPSAASLFDLPTQATAGSDASYFDDLSVGRKEVDVYAWLQKAFRPKAAREEEPKTVSDEELALMRIEIETAELMAAAEVALDAGEDIGDPVRLDSIDDITPAQLAMAIARMRRNSDRVGDTR